MCEANTFQNISGQTFCHICGESSIAVSNHQSCRCRSGHIADSTLLSAPVCTACAENYYRTASSDNFCIACGAHMQCPAASTFQWNCMCNASFTFTGSCDTCKACGAGTYKDSIQNNGPSDCTSCPGNSFSPSTSTHLSNCTCNAGFTRSQGTAACDACRKGTFKASQGDGPCQDCGVGTYNPHLNTTKCFDCYNKSASLAGINALADCVCDWATYYLTTTAGGVWWARLTMARQSSALTVWGTRTRTSPGSLCVLAVGRTRPRTTSRTWPASATGASSSKKGDVRDAPPTSSRMPLATRPAPRASQTHSLPARPRPRVTVCATTAITRRARARALPVQRANSQTL